MDTKNRHAIPLITFTSHARKLFWRNEKHEKLHSLFLPVCHVVCYLGRMKTPWEQPGSATLVEAQSSPSLLQVLLRTYPGHNATTGAYTIICSALKYCFLHSRGNSVSTQPHSVYGHSGSLTHHNNISLIK